jgi:hypothetical protein
MNGMEIFFWYLRWLQKDLRNNRMLKSLKINLCYATFLVLKRSGYLYDENNFTCRSIKLN